MKSRIISLFSVSFLLLFHTLIAYGNSPPIIDPGGPYIAIAGETIYFDASGTTDPDGDTLTYLWYLDDGPPQFPSNNPITTHIYEDHGTYNAILTVTDSYNDAVQVEVSVTINPNSSPQVDPGGPYIAIAGETIYFDASGTTDPDGDELTYLWLFPDGSPPQFPSSNPITTHIFHQPGTYNALLVVTDSYSEPVTVEVSVTINPNSPPQVDPGGPYIAAPGETIQFDASGTTDPDGDTLTYMWYFDDGSPPQFPSNNPITTHIYDEPGTYNAILTVGDSYSDAVTVEVSVLITLNSPPQVDPGGPYIALPGETIYFDASGTTDPDGDTLTYLWYFDDDSPRQFPRKNPITTHIYKDIGTYNAVLAVNDSYNDPVRVEVPVIISISHCNYYLPGDLNDDCIINLSDLAIIAAGWLTDCNTEPIDRSCTPK